MRRISISAILTLTMILGAWSFTLAGNTSDYAEFDGTNAANQPGSGALCGARWPQRNDLYLSRERFQFQLRHRRAAVDALRWR